MACFYLMGSPSRFVNVVMGGEEVHRDGRGGEEVHRDGRGGGA